MIIAVVGDTGVGKSSLINAALGEQRAPVGFGAPVRIAHNGAQFFGNADGSLGFWDFEGFHHGGKEPPRERFDRQLTWISRWDEPQRIDVAWVCWQASSARVTPGQRELVRELTKHKLPTIGVVTKAFATHAGVVEEHLAFVRWLETAGIGLTHPEVFPVATRAEAEFGLVTHGLDRLMEATATLVASRERELELEKSRSRRERRANKL